MTTLLGLAAILFMIAGVVFLFAAAVGVLRFPDPLQRMHASTKAGTIGAVLIVLGAALGQAQSDTWFIAVLAIGFLLLTVPIAGHLLGRATYISGARLTGIADNDALEGLLDRQAEPLERRVDVPQTGQAREGSRPRGR